MQDKHFKNERAATFWANRCVFFHKMFLQNNAGRKKAPRKGAKHGFIFRPQGPTPSAARNLTISEARVSGRTPRPFRSRGGYHPPETSPQRKGFPWRGSLFVPGAEGKRRFPALLAPPLGELAQRVYGRAVTERVLPRRAATPLSRCATALPGAGRAKFTPAQAADSRLYGRRGQGPALPARIKNRGRLETAPGVCGRSDIMRLLFTGFSDRSSRGRAAAAPGRG